MDSVVLMFECGKHPGHIITLRMPWTHIGVLMFSPVAPPELHAFGTQTYLFSFCLRKWAFWKMDYKSGKLYSIRFPLHTINCTCQYYGTLLQNVFYVESTKHEKSPFVAFCNTISTSIPYFVSNSILRKALVPWMEVFKCLQNYGWAKVTTRICVNGTRVHRPRLFPAKQPCLVQRLRLLKCCVYINYWHSVLLNKMVFVICVLLLKWFL